MFRHRCLRSEGRCGRRADHPGRCLMGERFCVFTLPLTEFLSLDVDEEPIVVGDVLHFFRSEFVDLDVWSLIRSRQWGEFRALGTEIDRLYDLLSLGLELDALDMMESVDDLILFPTEEESRAWGQLDDYPHSRRELARLVTEFPNSKVVIEGHVTVDASFSLNSPTTSVVVENEIG